VYVPPEAYRKPPFQNFSPQFWQVIVNIIYTIVNGLESILELLMDQKKHFCGKCAVEFKPKPWQRYCSSQCQTVSAVLRQRTKAKLNIPVICHNKASARLHDRQCHNMPCTAFVEAEKPLPEPFYGWGRPGDPILSGDDVVIEFDPDGYPTLPACLDRRRSP
jgi:hypothetical protein